MLQAKVIANRARAPHPARATRVQDSRDHVMRHRHFARMHQRNDGALFTRGREQETQRALAIRGAQGVRNHFIRPLHQFAVPRRPAHACRHCGVLDICHVQPPII
ncbi:hypothetical protein G6F57_022669 [Rhizopus arrhizus]|nr:hypothetical protein G6F57_022669 [Rhizopus arrhizus]